MCKQSIKVAVLMGGVGAERDVSLASGRAVSAALRQTDLTVVEHDLHPENLSLLDDPTIDVLFPVLHGTFGEDGQLQAILSERALCFVGSDAISCALTFDKLRTKERVQAAGVQTPPSVAYASKSEQELRSTIEDWGKWVVKPIRQGSSVGVTICADLEEVLPVARQTDREYDGAMIEQYIEGSEVTVGVFLDKALPVIEIVPRQPFYDYYAKYEAEETQYLFSSLPESVIQTLQEWALLSFQTLNMQHFGRIDFLLDADGKPWFLEANAIPGMTSHSLVPKAAEHLGLSMANMCYYLVQAAIEDRKKQNQKSRCKSLESRI